MFNVKENKKLGSPKILTSNFPYFLFAFLRFHYCKFDRKMDLIFLKNNPLHFVYSKWGSNLNRAMICAMDFHLQVYLEALPASFADQIYRNKDNIFSFEVNNIFIDFQYSLHLYATIVYDFIHKFS